jgi:uncharacterized protein YjbI with pentapeptide repeats
MADPVEWETCTDDDCAGVRLPTGSKCWAHADNSDLDAALKQLGEHGRLDARGVLVAEELLRRLLAAAPQDDQGHAVLTGARFDRATFEGNVRFDEATFQGDVRFVKATFQGLAVFYRTTFQGDATLVEATFRDLAAFDAATFQGVAGFTGAAFQRGASFTQATFRRDASFDLAEFRGGGGRFAKATFQGEATFYGATFRDLAVFDEAIFQGLARFLEATFHSISFEKTAFQRDASFTRVVFRGPAWFDRATFQGDARFYLPTFLNDASFNGAIFQRVQQLGPMLVRKSLRLDETIFHERAQIEVSAAAVCCQRTRFLAGVQLRVRWAQIVLDDADLAASSILAGMPPWLELGEGRWARALERLKRLRATGTPAGRPELVALRRADVAGLTVASVDLRACRFAGANHLDRLRIEESDFADSPRGWRWTSRQTIAEEHHWRAEQAGKVRDGTGWYCPAYQPPAWLAVEPLTPAQVAALYRALRKGREDSKDEPGAADFYYGEMEMRRHDPAKPKSERFVVLLYWLFSGYALRASRALAWLLGVLVVASVVLAAVGLEQPPAGVDWSFAARLGTAVVVAVEGAVFRAAEQQLTYMGRLVQAVLRFTGPVLLGLAVLSIRGRVKR